MKVLVDASFPVSVDDLANPYGLKFSRLTEHAEDGDLVRIAVSGGYAALVVMGDAYLVDGVLGFAAQEAELLLVCAVSDDPLVATNHLSSAAGAIARRLRGHVVEPHWLRADGLRPARLSYGGAEPRSSSAP